MLVPEIQPTNDSKVILCCITLCGVTVYHYKLPHHYLFVQNERLQLKVFAYLRLNADQKAIFAGKWRMWHRRRIALDRQLTSALRHLLSVTPSPAAIPSDALQLANTLCPGV